MRKYLVVILATVVVAILTSVTIVKVMSPKDSESKHDQHSVEDSNENTISHEDPDIQEELSQETETSEEVDFVDKLTTDAEAPKEMDNPSEWNGWDYVVDINTLTDIITELPWSLTDPYCDIYGIPYDDDLSLFYTAATAVSDKYMVDVSNATAGSPSAFPAIVHNGTYFHMEIDSVVYMTFTFDDVIYLVSSENINMQ